jgi:O-antigen/teichoic acid export membrane protein
MNNKIPNIQINKKDLLWNYISTSLQIGSGILLFPVILRLLSPETVGIWSIFLSIGSLVGLLDFGFSTSFSRNITYIFSGVNQLKSIGISDERSPDVNYILLAKTIKAMRWFYSRIGILTFIILSLLGTIYIYYIVENKFNGDKIDIYVSWALFCIINTYNIYTLYYDSLLLGRGYVKQDKQIIIISQISYLLISIILVVSGFGLISLIVGRIIALVLKRQLSYRLFFDCDLKIHLTEFKNLDYKEILNVIKPNAIKVGLTGVSAFLVLQSATLIGSWYISLSLIASYSITVQVINVIASLSKVYYTTNLPNIAQLRVMNDFSRIKNIFINNVIIMILTYIFSIVLLLVFGNRLLQEIDSKTFILIPSMICVIGLISFLEENHGVAAGFLLSKNEVPFYKAAIISGISTIVLLFVFLKYLNYGIWGMILAPGIAQLVYQNWKWPLHLIKDLNKKNNING